MLTIFTHCKSFHGHFAVIQRNAIESWMRLRPRCEIVLCGDRPGTEDVAGELGLHHLRDTQRSDYGTPLLSDLFDKVQKLTNSDLYCFTNCDIIFPGTFTAAVAMVRPRLKKFLLMGECWNLDITQPLDFASADWEESLQRAVRQRGSPRGPHGIDYFVFPRNFYGQLPPFVLGTAGFDNWLIWRARALGGAAIDASQFMLPIHQNHDYSHVVGGKEWARKGADAQRNMSLAGGLRHIYSTRDATHRLDATGVHRNWATLLRFGIRYDTMVKLGWKVAEFTRPLRHRLGLRPQNFTRLLSAVRRS